MYNRNCEKVWTRYYAQSKQSMVQPGQVSNILQDTQITKFITFTPTAKPFFFGRKEYIATGRTYKLQTDKLQPSISGVPTATPKK